MKKGKHYRKEPKKVRFNKALLLGAVSLLLVAMMAVTSTVSWIEDVSQVVIAAQKADIALQLTLQMRNRAMSAYQEIMRMQV